MSVAGVPRVALDGDALDLLELVLGGALSGLPPLPGVPAGVELVLTDAENAPLAHARGADGAGPVVRALRPFAHGAGPQWDPVLRRSAPDVRAGLRALVGDGRVLAVVVDEPPTLGDRRTVSDAVAPSGASAVLCVMPARRRPHPPGEVGAAGIVRAGLAFADELRAAHPGVPVVSVVLPWPGTGSLAAPGSEDGGADGIPGLDGVLSAYGATATVRLGGLRDPEERERVADVPRAFERSVRAAYPPASAAEIIRAAGQRQPRGAVVFFTGLSGSGKSTIARALAEDLADRDARQVTLLDGDEVRQTLSADLGFDAVSRERNIERIAYVASLVAAHGGVAIAAPIAPFAAGRRRARDLARRHGGFVLVHVSTPLETCEARDRKGLYAQARAGLVPEFTGITSPYEAPDDADVVVDTTDLDLADAVQAVRSAVERALAEPALSRSDGGSG